MSMGISKQVRRAARATVRQRLNMSFDQWDKQRSETMATCKATSRLQFMASYEIAYNEGLMLNPCPAMDMNSASP